MDIEVPIINAETAPAPYSSIWGESVPVIAIPVTVPKAAPTIASVKYSQNVKRKILPRVIPRQRITAYSRSRLWVERYAAKELTAPSINKSTGTSKCSVLMFPRISSNVLRRISSFILTANAGRIPD